MAFPASPTNGQSHVENGVTYQYTLASKSWHRVAASAALITSVALLPAGAANGDRAIVTDATSTTFGSIVIGGGAYSVPVYRIGGQWRIG